MKIKSLRFGELDVKDDDILYFPEGLVGLTQNLRFVMFRDPESDEVFWLQSAEAPEFALALIHSSRLDHRYNVLLAPQDVALLELEDPSETEVFLILNRVDKQFCVNLRGPIVLNANKMRGKQIVLNDPAMSLRHPIGSRVKLESTFSAT